MKNRKSNLMLALILGCAFTSPAVLAQQGISAPEDDPCAPSGADLQAQMHADLSQQLERKIDAQRTQQYAVASRRGGQALEDAAQARHEQIARSVAQRWAQRMDERLVQMAAAPSSMDGESRLAEERPAEDAGGRPRPAMPIVVSQADSAQGGQVDRIKPVVCR